MSVEWDEEDVDDDPPIIDDAFKNVERGLICEITNDFLDKKVGEGKHKTCRTIFDGFDIQNQTTLVYEHESLVEEYDPEDNYIFVKENLGLKYFYHTYYCSSISLFNRLGQRIKPSSESERERIAKEFLNLITKEEQPIVNLFVICWNKLDNENPPTAIQCYKFLGSYKIDQVESLANGAITWRRVYDYL